VGLLMAIDPIAATDVDVDVRKAEQRVTVPVAA
jgi:hypothetical protein